jgi:hypothetical protein
LVTNLNLTGFYRSVSARDSFGLAALLHIAMISDLPENTTGFTVRGPNFVRVVAFDPFAFEGFIVSTPPDSILSMTANPSGARICPAAESEFRVRSREAFFAEAVVCQPPEASATMKATRTATSEETDDVFVSPSVDDADSHQNPPIMIIVGIGAGGLFLTMGVLALVCIYRRRVIPPKSHYLLASGIERLPSPYTTTISGSTAVAGA